MTAEPAIKAVRIELHKRLPSLDSELTEPIHIDGTYLLECRLGRRTVHVEWTPGRTFGVTLWRDDGIYGGHPDTAFKSPEGAIEHAAVLLRGVNP